MAAHSEIDNEVCIPVSYDAVFVFTCSWILSSGDVTSLIVVNLLINPVIIYVNLKTWTVFELKHTYDGDYFMYLLLFLTKTFLFIVCGEFFSIIINTSVYFIDTLGGLVA